MPVARAVNRVLEPLGYWAEVFNEYIIFDRLGGSCRSAFLQQRQLPPDAKSFIANFDELSFPSTLDGACIPTWTSRHLCEPFAFEIEDLPPC